MNKTLIEQEGMKIIKSILNELGSWPVLEGPSWNEGDFDWRQSVYKFRKVGYSVDYFMDFSVGVDVKNSTRRIIDVSRSASLQFVKTCVKTKTIVSNLRNFQCVQLCCKNVLSLNMFTANTYKNVQQKAPLTEYLKDFHEVVQ